MPSRVSAETITNATTEPAKLADLSLAELMNIEVTSVSKKSEKLTDAPAAIYVLTGEDIRRMGATSIPDALRYVPGLEVAQLDSHQWAITARGFNDTIANKLLVLMDGRSVYTPTFSGVFWDVQDTLLEDIDRIEVIRGPGAALWGANAVNGVINIITKSAKDTQGVYASAGGGSEELGFGSFRFGGKAREALYYRVYGQYALHNDSYLPGGDDAADEWWQGRGGFRVDWEANEQNQISFQGDLYSGVEQARYDLPTLVAPYVESKTDNQNVSGGNLLGRWTHIFSPDSDLTVLAYYDRTVRDYLVLNETRDTGDVELQHSFSLGARQQVIWGLGYWVTHDNTKDSFFLEINPPRRTDQVFSTFIQNEITVVPERLRLTLGSKFEHNDYTGFEIQPNARLLWTPTDRQSVWASVARAVRTPSLIEADGRANYQVIPDNVLFPGAPPAVVAVTGNSDYGSEELWAFELGYRIQPNQRVSFDLATFYNHYDSLRSSKTPTTPELENDPAPPHLVLFSPLNNAAQAQTYGVELASNWQAANWCRLLGSYTFLRLFTQTESGSQSIESDEGNVPQQQFSLRSQIDLPHHFQFDLGLRYVDELQAQKVPGYVELDARLAWRPTKNLEFSVVGQNLLDGHHPEFKPTFIPTQATEVERSVYGKVTWRF